eukprot:Phypoly_transcript_00113.p1 GENE.Phypoly_transcript_00113~~Phypoly_transcript_00113.p1  ORF type:complete len:2230 (+),score=343.31 Phypoly_transcript_00113:65-6691(+)
MTSLSISPPSTSSSPPLTPTSTSAPASPHLRYPSTRDFSALHPQNLVSNRLILKPSPLAHDESKHQSSPPSSSSSSSNSSTNVTMNGNSNVSVKKKDDPATIGSRSKLRTENTNEELVVKPLKWTEYETMYRNSVERIPKTLQFPSDDISVESWPKPLRVIWNMAPSPFELGIDTATRYTISILFSDFTTVNHKYKNFRMGKAKNWRQTAHGNPRFNPNPQYNHTDSSGSPRMALMWETDAKISTLTNVRTSVTLSPLPLPGFLDEGVNHDEIVPSSSTCTEEDRPTSPSVEGRESKGSSKSSLAISTGSVNPKSGSFLLFNNLRRASDAGVHASYSPGPTSPVLVSSPVLASSPAPFRRGTITDGSEVRRASESDDVRNLSGEIRSNLLMKPFPQFSTLDLLIESVECKLSMEVEPLFCTIALYDVEKQLKISENFHLVLHSDLLPEHMKLVCDMFSRRCVFNTPVHGRIYYVIRICNLFRGVSGKDSSSVYLKAKSNQNMDSFKKDLREKLSIFTSVQGTPFVQFPKQHLAWAAFPAFDKGPSGWSVRGEEVPLKCDTFFLFKTNQTDAEICSILLSEKEMRKNKTTFGTLSMKVRPVLGELSRYADVAVSPSGVPIIPCNKIETTEKWQYVRELEQFIPAPIPNSEFVNNMYIYPEYVHLRNKANLQIMVQIVDSIDKYPWPILRTAYPAGGVVDFEGDPDSQKRTPMLDLCDVSAVNYKCETPYFYDEFKLRIPINLKNHCLLFTFHHINPSSKKDFRTVIGYAAIPLFNSENKILRDGTYTLAISPHTKNIDTTPRTSEDALAKLSYIRFRTRLASTVFTQDEVLSSLFENATTSTSSIVTYESIRSLHRADKVDCVRFFPVIAAHIFKVMCDNHNEIEGGTFAATDPTLSKDVGSPRSSRAMSDVTGANAPINLMNNLIPRPHSAQTISHGNPPPLGRLTTISSAPHPISQSSNTVPPPLDPPSSDSESDSDSYAPELGSPRELLKSPRDHIIKPRERSGSFAGESLEARPESHSEGHSSARAATISAGSSPPLRAVTEAKNSSTGTLPSPKRSLKSKLLMQHAPMHDSAPNLHAIAQHSPTHAASIFGSSRHSLTSINPPSPLNSSSPNVPTVPLPNGSLDPDHGRDDLEIKSEPNSPRAAAPLPRSPKSSSGSFGVGSSKFRFNRFTLSPHQVRKVNKDDNSEVESEENSVRYRKNMKAADFGITHSEFAKEAFYSLVTLLQVVDGTSSKFMEKSDEASPILAHYTHFIFNNPQVYAPLTHYWKLALTEKHPSVQGFKLNWVFFSLITKSMALQLHCNGLFVDDFNRAARFRGNFCNNLRALVPFFVPNIQTQRGYDAFTEFPLFVNDLFPLLDRGVILELVHTYISTIDKNEDILRVTAVFSFLKTISDYEHFLPLNIPVATETVDSVIDLHLKFWQNHILIGILLSEVDNCFKKAVAARTQALSTLKALLKKHEIDPRYQDVTIKQHITCMYFPFVLMVVERIETVAKFERSEKTDIYRAVLWIVSNLSSSLLRSWFVRDTQRRQAGFLAMMESSIDLLGPMYGETICNVIGYIIADCKDDLSNTTPLLDALLHLTAKALSLTADYKTFERVVDLMESLVEVARNPFFLQNNNMCEVICYELFLVTNHSYENIRSRAAKLVFFLMQKNLTETSNIARTKAQATVAISRLVGAGKLQDYSAFHQSMTELMTMERDQRGDDGLKEGVVEETAKKILNLVKDTAKLASTNDAESVAEIYYRISLVYTETPNMRLTWLDNLANHHRKSKCWDEAAQAHLLSAHLIAQYHAFLRADNPPLPPSLFQSVCPNAEKEPPLGNQHHIQQGQFQDAIWGIKSLVAQLDNATKYFTFAGHLDLTLEVLSLISHVHKVQRAYSELSQLLDKSKVVCEALIQKEKKKEPRTSYKFYRIGFYGLAEEDPDGIEYIYKMPAECHINSMNTTIKEQLQQKLPGTEVILLPNAEVSLASLDPKKAYYQVLSVEPFFEASEAHLAGFGPHFNCYQFIAEVALNLEGKLAQDGDLARQQKRKTIYTTVMRFPSYSNRLAVKNKRDIVLTPLENAIEQLGSRIAKIREQLDCSPPRIKPLQQIIQGSVSPMVNEGPLKLCETFIMKAEMYNPVHIDQLRQTLYEFVRTCGFAIHLNRAIIGPQDIQFQKMVEEQYSKLRDKANKLISTNTPSSGSALTNSFISPSAILSTDSEENQM